MRGILILIVTTLLVGTVPLLQSGGADHACASEPDGATYGTIVGDNHESSPGSVPGDGKTRSLDAALEGLAYACFPIQNCGGPGENRIVAAYGYWSDLNNDGVMDHASVAEPTNEVVPDSEPVVGHVMWGAGAGGSAGGVGPVTLSHVAATNTFEGKVTIPLHVLGDVYLVVQAGQLRDVDRCTVP